LNIITFCADPILIKPLDPQRSAVRKASIARSARMGAFIRYVVAIGIGVAVTPAWQSYGETTKQIIAMSAPQLGWSPEAQQMIVAFMGELG
jgi:hypothetical protein